MRDPVPEAIVPELHYSSPESERELLAMVLAHDAEDAFIELLPPDKDAQALYRSPY